ncbi:ATP-binding protein [Spiroplasma endosymbiont of Atherix ibis]|uniref:ATP-binding protein n=1 Tax=Spiroplasma endosymbiont of Atherix ibis TaxID=3066291 RepID=UPI0030CDCC30
MTKIQNDFYDILNQFLKYKNNYNKLDFKTQWDTNFKSLSTRLKESDLLNNNLYIFGNTGVGKTYFSQELINGRGMYYKWYEIINDVLNGDNKIRKYFNSDIIVIDDFLSKKPTEYNINIFYEIIDTRLENKKQTIITTNYSPKEFKNILQNLGTIEHYLQNRISSRMNLFDFYEFKGNDKRKK